MNVGGGRDKSSGGGGQGVVIDRWQA